MGGERGRNCSEINASSGREVNTYILNLERARMGSHISGLRRSIPRQSGDRTAQTLRRVLLAHHERKSAPGPGQCGPNQCSVSQPSLTNSTREQPSSPLP
jgi:hypothetical protein